MRRVACKRTKASGSVWALPAAACDPKGRPPGRGPCASRPCVVEPGGQVTLVLDRVPAVVTLTLTDFRVFIFQ